MAYNEESANRLRLAFLERGVTFEEKKMMGGLCFMVDNKMCMGTHIDKKTGETLLMARLGAEQVQANIDQPGALPMDFTGRPMKDYLFINQAGTEEDKAFGRWVDLALAFNPLAKASKKRKK
ncbi:MAG: TfoX/Sxy family protein [Bacteroidota bacterium]